MSRFGVVALVASALAGAVACDDVGGPSQGTDRAVDVYAAVLRAVTADVPVPATREDRLPVFVEPAGPDVEIPLDVQVGVVNELEDEADVRFIDTRDEAIDGGGPGAPVVDEGVLVGLGAIPDGDSRVTVYADRYWGAGEERAFSVSVARSGGTWSAVGTEEAPLSG